MARRYTRRQFLAGAGGVAGLSLAAPIIGRTAAFGAPVDPATAGRNRLVLVFLFGGNDGLNTVAPVADVAGAARRSVYERVRPTLALPAATLLPLDRAGDADHALGLNPRLPTVHRLYRDDRVAVVQGVDYPNHSYSHFTSSDIWQSGLPTQITSGWLGRHLDRSGIGDGELRAVAVGSELPLALRGTALTGANIASIAATKFVDGYGPIPDSRHGALRLFRDHTVDEPVRRFAGRTAANTADVVDAMFHVPAPPGTGSVLADQLLTARTLMEHDLGVEIAMVTQAGYDTHTNQRSAHENLLTDLDRALESFFFGTRGGVAIPGVGPLTPALAGRTTVVVFSEFGRRIGENLSGTDHGAAAPVFLVGPPPGAAVNGTAVVPGIHGDHPNLGSVALPADNLAMTTDMRRVYQSLLEQWLGDPEPAYSTIGGLPGLFSGTLGAAAAPAAPATAATPATPAAGSGSGSGSTSATGPATVAAATPVAPGESGPGLVDLGGARLAADRSSLSATTTGVAAAFAANALAAALAVRTGAVRRVTAAVAGSADPGVTEEA